MKRGQIFSLYPVLFKRKLKRLFLLFKEKYNPHLIIIKKKFHVTVAVILLTVILVNLFQFWSVPIVQGATYTFVQRDWSGGVSNSVIVHPDNQTGWNSFSTSTNTFTSGTTTVSIASSTYSSTDDGTFSSTGSATGGGFSNGATSTTSISGSGSSASIKLSGSTTAVNRVTATTTMTGAFYHGGGQMVGAAGSDYLYIIEGGNRAAPLRRLTISTAATSSLATYTYAYFGAQLLWNGSDDYIYLAEGQNDKFDRYSISGNSWTSMANFPASLPTDVSETAALRYNTEDYIYFFRGSRFADFYRYSISGNSWSSLTSLPIVAGYGIQATRDANSDSIYVLPANGTNFYRYSIAGDSWTSMAAVPLSFGTTTNAGILHDEGSDYIYLLVGDHLYRYSISGNSWTTMADASSVNPDFGTTLLHTAGEDTIYVTGQWDCCASVRVWAYSISGDSWTQYAIVSNHSGGYGSPNKTAFRRTSDESFYFITAAGGDSEVFKYTISQTIYNSSGNFTSASLDLGVAKMNSLSWTSTTPSGVGSNSIQFQLAANNDNSTWNYVGPDGTNSTFFTSNGTTSFPSSLLNKRYWRYKAFLTTADTTVSPSLDSVTFSYSSYATSSSLISSIYDTVDPTNVLASIGWSPFLPTSTTIKFQLRTGSSTSSINSATWVGPDGTASTFFTNSSGETTTSTMRDGSGDRYFQYKAFLQTTNPAFTPVLSSVTSTYVVNANPEIQNVSASENGSGVVTITYQARDPDTSTGTVNPGFVSSTFEYLDANGAYQTIPANQLSAGANSNLAVQGVNWTTSTVSWTLPSGLNIAASRIRVTVNDNEAANNTAASSSPTFQIDSVAPSATSVIVDGSQTPALLTFNVSDSSTLFMKVSENSTLSDVSTWSAFTATTTFTLSSNPDTVYAQFKDVYGNTSTIVHATTPQTPNSFIVQDNSNVLNGATDYRLFVAWRVVATPSPGFGSYKVYRSEDQSTWTLISTISSISDNFVTDNTTVSNTLYYYKVKTVDADGNTSVFSSIVNGRANGAQDAGEGGGGSGVGSDPVITSVATSSPTPSSITITWDTDALSNSVVGFSTTPGNFTDNTVTVNSMVNNSSGVGNHNVVLGGLVPNTTYYFNVKSVSASNASSTDSNGGNGYIFTTPSGPTITGVSAVEVNNTFARVVWSTSENSNSSVIYSTSTSLTNSVTTSSVQMGTAHDMTLTGLTAGTRYYFYVQSVNGSGVTSTDKNLVGGILQYFNLATTLDSTGPTISSIATTTSDNSANITWNTNESADSQIIYGLTTSYGSTTTLDSTFTTQHLMTLSGLSSSTAYHFKILSRDKNNNLTASADQLIITSATPDTTAPIITSVATSSVSLTGATVTWTTDELASSIVEYGITTSSYSSLAGSNSDSVTSHSVSLASLSGNTAYYFRVRSADSAGNSAMSDNSGQGWQFVTVADTTGPVISDVNLLVNDTSVAISWTTNEPASSEVDYDTTSSTFGFSSSTASLVTNHTITITGLTTNVTYFFRLKSTDSAGNTTIDNNGGAAYSFTTQQTPGLVRVGGGGGGAPRDTDPPEISNLSITDIAPSSASVIWQTSEDGNSLVRFGSSIKYGTLTGNDSELLTSKHNVSLFDLKPGQTYHLRAVTYDAAGNRAESIDKTFSTLNSDGSEVTPSTSTEKTPEEEVTPETQFISDSLQKASSQSLQKFLADIASNPFLKNIPEDKFIQAIFEMTSKVVEAPTIVGVKPTVEVKGTSALIRWSTDKKSSSELNYARDVDYKPASNNAYTNAAVNPDEFSVNHSVQLTGLDPGVLYHFKVSSKGLIGPAAVSGDYTFLTTGDLPIISNIKVARPTESQSSIIVDWRTNIPTAGTVEYKNVKSGQSLTQGDETLLVNHEVALKGLEGGVNYTLVIKARDEFKNEVASLPITFSTLLDKISPVITKLSSESTLYPGKDSKVQTIISWETDEPATSQVFYQEGLAGDNVISLPLDTSLNTRHVVVITKFKPGTVYKYWVESKDLAGNNGKSEIFSILTPQQKETIVDIIINNFQSVFGWTKNIGL
ncbi:MAG TPA: fibronectin type III domain-containing protein [Candidatus Udaeobacter sp.]|nr:fibronectin type III domain-containing protein [Candidatus Udaeobacter sp.]